MQTYVLLSLFCLGLLENVLNQIEAIVLEIAHLCAIPPLKIILLQMARKPQIVTKLRATTSASKPLEINAHM